MQGIDECYNELKNRGIMKKNDKRIKPIFYENVIFDNCLENAIIAKYSIDKEFKKCYIMKLN